MGDPADPEALNPFEGMKGEAVARLRYEEFAREAEDGE